MECQENKYLSCRMEVSKREGSANKPTVLSIDSLGAATISTSIIRLLHHTKHLIECHIRIGMPCYLERSS